MHSIKHYLIINTSPEVIYEALTDQKGLASWWTEDTIAEPHVGSKIDFIFGEYYHDKMLITNLEKNKKVEWECTFGHEEWVGTKFKFDLESQKDETIVRFEHSDWKGETDFFANCNYHWGYYLRSLKLLCETGEGTPFKKDN